MSDDKDSDERDHIDKNDEEIVTNDIEVLKLEKKIAEKYRQYWEIIWWNKLDGYEWW